jgi:hypothetical protein
MAHRETAASLFQRRRVVGPRFGVAHVDVALAPPRSAAQKGDAVQGAWRPGQTVALAGPAATGKTEWLYRLVATHVVGGGAAVWVACGALFDSARFLVVLEQALCEARATPYSRLLAAVGGRAALEALLRSYLAAVRIARCDGVAQVLGTLCALTPGDFKADGDAKRPRDGAAATAASVAPLLVIDGWGVAVSEHVEQAVEGALPTTAVLAFARRTCPDVAVAIACTTWPPAGATAPAGAAAAGAVTTVRLDDVLPRSLQGIDAVAAVMVFTPGDATAPEAGCTDRCPAAPHAHGVSTIAVARPATTAAPAWRRGDTGAMLLRPVASFMVAAEGVRCTQLFDAPAALC